MEANRVWSGLWRGIRWLAGEDFPSRNSQPAVDALEPYCDVQVLQQRLHDAGALPAGTHKAIHKIGARYGAKL